MNSLNLPNLLSRLFVSGVPYIMYCAIFDITSVTYYLFSDFQQCSQLRQVYFYAFLHVSSVW